MYSASCASAGSMVAVSTYKATPSFPNIMPVSLVQNQGGLDSRRNTSGLNQNIAYYRTIVSCYNAEFNDIIIIIILVSSMTVDNFCFFVFPLHQAFRKKTLGQ